MSEQSAEARLALKRTAGVLQHLERHGLGEATRTVHDRLEDTAEAALSDLPSEFIPTEHHRTRLSRPVGTAICRAMDGQFSGRARIARPIPARVTRPAPAARGGGHSPRKITASSVAPTGSSTVRDETTDART